VRSEFGRQKSQNSTSTGRPTCLSMRSGATFTQGRSFGNGGAAMVSTGARMGRVTLATAAGTPAVTRRTEAGRSSDLARTLSGDMTMPENTPPGGEDPGRGLSGVQRAGIVLGGLAVLLIVFVVLQGADDSGSPSSSSAPQTTATQTTATEAATTDDSGEDSTTGTTTDDSGSTTGTTTDDSGSGGGGSDGDAESETGTTETQPSAPAVRTIRVVNGRPAGGVRRLEYQRGDRIRFKVQSDVTDEVHVHGYDVSKNVSAGSSVTFSFTANIEGRFEIELENAHTQIAELEVKPS
jgi:hypothetical protein